jgi:hypothetical protein
MPLPLLLLLAAIASGLAAPLLVGAYHRFCVYVFRKTGTHLPDSPQVDADIVAVTKALLPELLAEAIARKIDPAALEAAVEAALARAKAKV